MRPAGFLLLISGGVIALFAIAILPSSGSRGTFLAASIAVEAIGLGLVIRSHMPVKEERG